MQHTSTKTLRLSFALCATLTHMFSFAESAESTHKQTPLVSCAEREQFLRESIDLLMQQSQYCQKQAIDVRTLAAKTAGLSKKQLAHMLESGIAAAHKLAVPFAYTHCIWGLYTETMQTKNETLLRKIFSQEFIANHETGITAFLTHYSEIGNFLTYILPECVVDAAHAVPEVFASSVGYSVVTTVPLVALGYCIFDTVREKYFQDDKNIFYDVEHALLRITAQEKEAALKDAITQLEGKISLTKKNCARTHARMALVQKIIAAHGTPCNAQGIPMSLAKDCIAFEKQWGTQELRRVIDILSASQSVSLETILNTARTCRAS